nr:fasciclin domain-containing protein [Bacteroidales bacterium]
MKIINYKTTLYLLILFFGYSCQEPDFVESTSDDTLIGEYLEEEESFSEFVKILNLTGNLSFLKAYGTYTCFVPTNDAIAEYVTEKGVSAIDELSLDELDDLVKYHIVLDTISSSNFSDGKLNTPNMYGQYLLVNGKNENGEAKSVINKYAELLQVDHQHSNGVVHSIASVLQPITTSIAEQIETDAKYSIFTEALKTTGYYDILKEVEDPEVKEKHWFTVFAQTNTSYEKIGIKNYADLENKYASSNDPTDLTDSLNLYVAYHIIENQLLYMGDLALSQALLTKAPNEVITIKVNSDSVLLNEILFDDVLEKGSYVRRDISDNTSANGVFHAIDDELIIKVRYPFPVYFEVTDQPELRKMKDIYRKLGKTTLLSNDQLNDVSWYSDNLIEYKCDNGGSLAPGSLVQADYFMVTLRTAVIKWIEFKTPLLVKGKYNVWMCSRNTSSRKPMYTVSFNGDALQNTIDDNKTLPKNPLPSDGELLAMGYKRYNYTPIDSSSYYSDLHGRVVGKLAGVIEVSSTGNHTIRLDVINNERGGLW